MNPEELLTVLDGVAERLGDDTEIDSVMADLILLKDNISVAKQTVDELTEEINRLNEKNLSLMSSNNKLFRQLNIQREAVERAAEEVSATSLIDNII